MNEISLHTGWLMNILKKLDNTVVRGYALIVAVVTVPSGTLMASNLFPEWIRQFSAPVLLFGTFLAMFVVYAPKLEGYINRWHRRATTLTLNETRSRLCVIERTNLFWTYFKLDEETARWCENNCSGRYGVLPLQSGEKANSHNKTVWFSEPNDALNFKMVWF